MIIIIDVSSKHNDACVMLLFKPANLQNIFDTTIYKLKKLAEGRR
jgi:hypothetical protein